MKNRHGQMDQDLWVRELKQMISDLADALDEVMETDGGLGWKHTELVKKARE